MTMKAPRVAGGRPIPPAKIGLFKAFYQFMTDSRASLPGKLFIVAVFLYVIMPIDFIPDVAPIIGWLDDLGLAGLAVAYLSSALGPYRDPSLRQLPQGTDPPGLT
jgi:uncharacterized membrane protein YkvA (DUF1232 family)